MAKTFRYKDDLGNILDSSPEPFVKSIKEALFEGFDDYSEPDTYNYNIFAETSNDSPPKYTLISKDNSYSNNTVQTNDENKKGSKQFESPKVQDVVASKMFEQSKMSTINTVYIGSLTLIGLYVLFKYMKY